MTVTREVKEGLQKQSAQESIAYIVTTTPWGSSPSGVTVTAYDVTGEERVDVSSTVLSGAASTSDDVITCPVLTALTSGSLYRVEVLFTADSNTWVCYFLVEAED